MRGMAVVRLFSMVFALLVVACGTDDPPDPPADAADVTPPDEGTQDVGGSDAPLPGDAIEDAGADTPPPPPTGDCDPLDPSECSLPWPSNRYLVPDASRTTGYQIEFGDKTFPANSEGKYSDTSAWQRMDGYSVGSPLIVRFPHLDASGLPDEYDVSPSLDADAPIVWLEVDGSTVSRVPYWAELNLRDADPARQALIVRPAVILKEGMRYVVAFRDLRTTSGEPVQPSDAFEKLRSGDTAADPELAPRQARFDEVFEILAAEGIEKAKLTLAWDFVTASGDALHGFMLHMRQDAFETVGPQGPELTITELDEYVQVDDGSGKPTNEYIGVDIKGTFRVPVYVVETQSEHAYGWVFDFGSDGLPQQAGWLDRPFWLRVPHSALDGTSTPHGMIQYGHGLLGRGSQAKGGWLAKVAHEHKFLIFACDWTGMSEDDQASVTYITTDIGLFPFLGDHMHQGIIESVLLARAMRERMPALPEITSRGVAVNTDEIFYYGNSQGGIYGGTYVAVSPDVKLGLLGVPGNNYNTLLQRSVDFGPFVLLMGQAYPDPTHQLIGLALVQLLWDQTDPVSYYRHITQEPFDGEPHYVLLHQAKGDWQVATVTNENVTRSGIGVALMSGYGRQVHLATETPYPHMGSALINFDFGNPWPPPGNRPPHDDFGDPHEHPRRQDHANAQMVHFFRSGGEVIDVCGGDACTPD